MHKYKLVIFDFDGTLADSFACFISSYNMIAGRYRLKPFDLTRLDELRRYSAREIMAHVELAWWKLPFVTSAIRRLMLERIEEIRAFEGVDQLLSGLQDAGVGIAIVTSNSEENVKHVLGPENVSRIGFFGCGASIFGKKTKLKAALKRTGLTPDEVLCVGDEIRDAEAALALGMDFVGVSWGYTNAAELQRHSRMKLCVDMHDVLNFATAA
jgi:phosphoglycolate phosphatase